MKKILQTILVFLLAAESLGALDLHDATCMQLKTVIDQAQPVNKVQEAWNKAVENKLSTQESQDLANQIITYAQEQKNTFEKQLSTLGDKDYDSSKLKWGIAKTVFGTWCAVGLLRMLVAAKKNKKLDMWEFFIAFPDLVLVNFFIGRPDSNRMAYGIAGLLIWARVGAAPYCLYKGIPQTKLALSYKQHLEEKIKNLTDIVAFVQPLANAVHRG